MPKVDSTSLPTVAPAALILLSIVAFIGVLVQYKHQEVPPIPNPQTPSTPMQKVIQPNALFYSKVFLNRNKTFISIPYRFDKEPLTLWLSLETQAHTPKIVRLMTHPTLTKISWPYFTDNNFTLYQKQKKYTNLADFIKNPPPQSVIMADPTLKNLPLFKSVKLIDLPDDPQAINLNQVDYILTSYLPKQRSEREVTFYEAIIDATTAAPDSNNSLSWLILAPLATEANPFYLGNIHVDYRQ
jgi:hypothetical protein